MNRLMEQLYADFIEPYIQHQPKGDFYGGHFDDYADCAPVEERDRTEAIREFYAIHAFLLGLQMGHALAESLSAPD